MHCPSCGTQQVSHETKYCSRCGMPLAIVTEVLNNGGFLPQLGELSRTKSGWFSRKNGMGFSVIWLIFWLLLAAIGGGVFNNEYIGATTAIIATFGGVIIFVFSLIFLKSGKRDPFLDRPDIAALSGANPANQSALPPGQFAGEPPLNPGWRDTSDLQRTSVIDSTTRLLDRDR